MQECNNQIDLLNALINKIKDTEVFSEEQKNKISSGLKLKIEEGLDIQEDIKILHNLYNFILKRQCLSLNNSIGINFGYKNDLSITIDLFSTSGVLKIPKEFKNISFVLSSFVGLQVYRKGETLKKKVDCTIYIYDINQLHSGLTKLNHINTLLSLLVHKYVIIENKASYLEYLIDIVKRIGRDEYAMYSKEYKYVLKLISNIEEVYVDVDKYINKFDEYSIIIIQTDIELVHTDYKHRLQMATNNLIKELETNLEKMYENN